jgi:hypothetical protein
MTADLRKHPRMPGNNRAAIIFGGGGAAPIMCTVADFSDGGAGLTVVNTAQVPDTFKLEIKGDPTIRTCRVAWRKEPHRLGVAFDQAAPVPPEK